MTGKIVMLILASIILLGFLVRLYRLGNIPNGFFFDEATISYQAYSLLQTGKDTWGTDFPLLSFRDYGEYILPIGVYGQIPSLLIGGLNVLSARFPHAILGILSVPLVYFLAKELFKNTKISLLSSFLLTISPLSIGWTRFVFEGNFGTVLFLSGTLLFARSLKKPRLLPWSILSFGLSALSYHIFLILTPLYFCLLSLLNRKSPSLIGHIRPITLIIVVFFLAWILAAIASGAGRQRFSQASTLLTPQKIDNLNHQIGYCSNQMSLTLCKVFLNKPVLAATSYLENYLAHFSPVFLGFDGTFLRQNVLPKSGILLPVEMVGFFVGLFFLVRSPTSLASRILLPIILIYPVANSFTGLGEISRIAFASPFLSLVAAYGLVRITQTFRVFKPPLFLAILYSVVSFLITYFLIFPKTNAYYTNFGYDKVFSWVRANQSKYDRIFISRNYAGSVPYISAQFFLPIDPQMFQRGQVERKKSPEGYYQIESVDQKFRFFQNLHSEALKPNDFVVATPEDIQSYALTPKFTIIDPTGRKLLLGVEANEILAKTAVP